MIKDATNVIPSDLKKVISSIPWDQWPMICQHLTESDQKLAKYIRLNLDAELQEFARKRVI